MQPILRETKSIDPKMTQILKLLDKNFKAAIITILHEVKKNMPKYRVHRTFQLRYIKHKSEFIGSIIHDNQKVKTTRMSIN